MRKLLGWKMALGASAILLSSSLARADDAEPAGDGDRQQAPRSAERARPPFGFPGRGGPGRNAGRPRRPDGEGGNRENAEGRDRPRAEGERSPRGPGSGGTRDGRGGHHAMTSRRGGPSRGRVGPHPGRHGGPPHCGFARHHGRSHGHAGRHHGGSPHHGFAGHHDRSHGHAGRHHDGPSHHGFEGHHGHPHGAASHRPAGRHHDGPHGRGGHDGGGDHPRGRPEHRPGMHQGQAPMPHGPMMSTASHRGEGPAADRGPGREGEVSHDARPSSRAAGDSSSLEARLDRLFSELEELRREIRR